MSITVESSTDISIILEDVNINVAVQNYPINIQVSTAGIQGPPGPPGLANNDDIIAYAIIFG